MDGLKICILYELNEDETPSVEPERPPRNGNGNGHGRNGNGKKVSRRRKLEHDRDEIFEALTRLGHHPFYHAVDGKTSTLNALTKIDADLVFNLVESYAGDDTKDMNMAAYLDLLGIPYTGAGPHALHLAQDKSLAKKIFAFHGIQTPFFATSYLGRIDHAHDIKFPLIVKPASEDGSIGIDAGAVVNSVKELMERIHYVHEEFNSPALVEEYIEGREIYAAIWGSYEHSEVLPLIELDLSKLKDTPRIACRDVKFNKETEAYKLTKSAPVQDLDEETTQNIRSTALAAYNALKLRDYGRIDMRLKKNGEVYVIEANPNPWLSARAEFAMAAKAAGFNYAEMIAHIVSLALSRYPRHNKDMVKSAATTAKV
jgi:D-alanine-D-alanine ligase